MHRVDCGCAFLALRTLARVEEYTTSSQVPLETAFQVTSEAERPCLAVLSCERCRQQRLPLTAVTILCAHLVEWLCRLWNLYEEETAETTSADSSSTTTTANTPPATSSNTVESPHSTQPWKFSLGNYDLAADEADALSNELMTLRLTGFSAVLGSLEAALVTSGSSSTNAPSPGKGANGTTSETAAFAPACLDLVRANLRLVRACIRRLKARSLLSNGGAGNLC